MGLKKKYFEIFKENMLSIDMKIKKNSFNDLWSTFFSCGIVLMLIETEAMTINQHASG